MSYAGMPTRSSQPEYTGQHMAWEVDQLNDQLENAVDELKLAGQDMAQSEHDYRVELAKKIWELRARSIPVTIVGDLARGDEAVALLKLRRDAAETSYKAAQENVNVRKIRVRTVADQIAREWGRPSNI